MILWCSIHFKAIQKFMILKVNDGRRGGFFLFDRNFVNRKEKSVYVRRYFTVSRGTWFWVLKWNTLSIHCVGIGIISLGKCLHVSIFKKIFKDLPKILKCHCKCLESIFSKIFFERANIFFSFLQQKYPKLRLYRLAIAIFNYLSVIVWLLNL